MIPSSQTNVTRRADSSAPRVMSSRAPARRDVGTSILQAGVGVGFVVLVTILALGGGVAARLTGNLRD